MPLKEVENQEHLGPWLDRLFPVRLASGRVASVTGFSVLPTNFGILEGGLAREINAQQRERVLALAKKRYGEPLVVIEPTIEPVAGPSSAPWGPRERYPWMACMAHLTSDPLVENNFNVSSDLTLVWWQDRFDVPLPAEIERIATGIEWERAARDVEFW